MTTFANSIDQVSSIYVGYFGRAGDPSGENYWLGRLNAGAITLAQIASSFATQPEALSKYPYLVAPTLADPGQFVDQVFQNLFNHPADAASKAYWVAQLQAAGGAASAVGPFILNVISGATGVDDTTIRNKVTVASDFTVKAASGGTTWNSGAGAQSSSEITATNETQASVTAAKAQTTAYIAAAPGPQQTLTLGIDALTTSAQNANFNAPLIFNPATGALIGSFQTGDKLFDTAPPTGAGLSNGGTFTVILNNDPGIFVPGVTIKGIPTHTFTHLPTSTGLQGADGYSGDITGVVTLNNLASNSLGSTFIGAAGNGIDKGGVAGTTTTAATLLGTVNLVNVTVGSTLVWVDAAALSGAADVLAINAVGPLGTGTAVNGSNTVAVMSDAAVTGRAANAYETINLAATSAANISLAGSSSGITSTTALNISGAGLVTLWGEFATTENHFTKVTAIDASANSGGVTVTGGASGVGQGFLSGNTVLALFRGGAGADSLDISSMTGAQAAAFTTLDGGAGRDTLILSPNAATATTPLPAKGFEIIGIAAGLAGTVDVARFGAGVDTVKLVGRALGSPDTVFNNLPDGFTFDGRDLSRDNNYAFNGPSGLSDSLALLVNNQTGNGTYADLATTGFETVNITATGTTIWGVNAALTLTPTAGSLVALNLVDDINFGFASVNFNGAVNLGAGTFRISSTLAGLAGKVNFASGNLTASVLDASRFHPDAAPTAEGVIMTGSDASASITIVGSSAADLLRGSGQADTIDGGAGNDTLDGRAGADLVTTGTGTDTVGRGNDFAAAGQSIVASGQNLTAAIAAGQTLVFNSGTIAAVDRITDFTSGTDKLDVATAAVAPTSLFGADGTTALNNGETYVLYGAWAAATGTFTVVSGYGVGGARDALVFQGDGTLSANTHTGTQVMIGLNQALIAADFV